MVDRPLDEYLSVKIRSMKEVVALIVAAILLVTGWQFLNKPPSTKSVCYTWSKATDYYLNSGAVENSGIDGAQWLADNLKKPEDLVNIDKDVLSAMRLYETGSFLTGQPLDDLRQFVLDTCEKAAPGSTKYSR